MAGKKASNKASSSKKSSSSRKSSAYIDFGKKHRAEVVAELAKKQGVPVCEFYKHDRANFGLVGRTLGEMWNNREGNC